MKKLFAYIGTCLLLISCSGQQNTSESSISKIEDSTEVAIQIKDSSETVIQPEDSTYVYEEYLAEKLYPIRDYVEKVDDISYSDWSLVLDRSFELNSEAVTATYFFWNEAMKKITLKFQDPAKKAESTYYFKAEELVFTLEQSLEEMGMDGSVLVINQSYFENGTLIRSINNQDCGAPFNEEYLKDEQKRILNDLEVIRQELKDSKIK